MTLCLILVVVGYHYAVVVIIPSKPLSVLLGDYISLNCVPIIPTSEEISYTWSHLDISTVLNVTSSILTFPSISMEQLGTYRCTAPAAVSLTGAEVIITSSSEI